MDTRTGLKMLEEAAKSQDVFLKTTLTKVQENLAPWKQKYKENHVNPTQSAQLFIKTGNRFVHWP